MSGPGDGHGDLHGRSEGVLASTIIFLLLSSIFVVLRMFSRAAIVRKVTVDDYIMVLAWTLGFGLTFCICFGCVYGLGRHEKDIPPSWQPTLGRVNYVFTVLYQPALMATKTSILAFYLSLPTTSRIFKWACVATLVIVNMGGLALALVSVFQCLPIGAAFRYPTPPMARCTDIVTIFLSSAPLNILTDLAMLFIPMPVLTGMNLPRKQKIILVVTFGFGIFAAAVDVIRIAYLQSAAHTRIREIHQQTGPDASLHNQEDSDFSWNVSLTFMWSAIEVDVGIMCACVPGLKPLVARFVPNMVRDSRDATGESKSNSVGSANGTAEMVERHPQPSLPDASGSVHRRDFSVSTNTDVSAHHGTMGMIQFLADPDVTNLPSLEQNDTARTNTTRNTGPRTPTFFDFVNVQGKKSMVQMTSRECLFPISMVTILFFIWGFEYGLLNILNKQFQRAAHMSPDQVTSIHSAYFAGYFAGPLLVGRLVLKYWGFKACYSVGLAIYGCGTMIFWPAAVLTSFPAFLIVNFIVAFGLSILELSANPFIALCGPAKYGEIRLNLSQGVQAIGSVVAPLIANRAFFRETIQTSSLVDAQWTYLAMSLFTILLAVAFYYVPLPEATDQELEEAAERMDNPHKTKIGGVRVIWITMAVAMFAQFCYVGAQEVNATSYWDYLGVIVPSRDPAVYLAIAHTTFAVSRFVAAGLGFWIKPRFLLLFFSLGAIVFEALAMNLTSSDANIAALTVAYFMEGPIYSLIFAQALRGMGRHTKITSVLITASISGGAVFAPISSALTYSSRGVSYLFIVAVVAFAAASLFPLYLNCFKKAANQVDPVKGVATSPEDGL